MTQSAFYFIIGATLMGIGLQGLLCKRHLLRKLIALNILSAGVFLVFVAIAARLGAPLPDPVPHALVLTGVVISVSATAYGIALARRIHATTGRVELPDENDAGEASSA